MQKVELVEQKQKILIIDKADSIVGQSLKKTLQKYDNEIFISPVIPPNTADFKYCFLINEKIKSSQTIDNSTTIYIFIDYHKTKHPPHVSHHKHNLISSKTITVVGDNDFIDANIEKILWFSFSKSRETALSLIQPFLKTAHTANGHKKNFLSAAGHKLLKFFLSTKVLITLSILLFTLYLTASALPLTFCTIQLYQTFKYLKSNDLQQSRAHLIQSQSWYKTSRVLYDAARPTLSLFSLSLYPDTVFDLNSKGISSANQAITLLENSNQLVKLILNKNKTPSELALISIRLEKIKSDINNLDDNLTAIDQKLPKNLFFTKKINGQITTIREALTKVKRFVPYIDWLLAKDSERKYLLLFANNMELRPGGGFIGSFGILTMKNYTLVDLAIYDVYDADGQLVAHVEPPAAIRDYLKQPHWFLRDSAFSPDFSENYQQAKVFLSREINQTGFSGGILVTTTAIKNILGAFDNIYLSDFNEVVNKDNFYIKAELYSEKNFFPGSTQKKSFLSTLARNMIMNLENISFNKLATALEQSLDEKQITTYFEDTQLQTIINSNYWAGQLITPVCPESATNCLSDFIFPLDANLGVNKANFFISRQISINVNVSSQGTVKNTVEIKFKNDSPNDVFPGGTYKNYFQILIPKNTTLAQITKNDSLVEKYDEVDDQFKRVGFWIEVKPQVPVTIKISYQNNQIIEKGKGYYQMIIQKQIGSGNSDINIKINLPTNIHVLNQNYSPLVKDQEINYNTNLSADKIFFLELIKE